MSRDLLASATDPGICELMAKVIDELTTTGKQTLDPKVLKRLFQNAGLSVEYLEVCTRLTFRQLEIDHAQIRYSTLLLINELVKRSTLFRTRVFFPNTDLMMHFAELTIKAVTEVRKKKAKKKRSQLRPQFVTLNLKKKAVEFLEDWAREYGDEDNDLKGILSHLTQKFGIVLKNVDSLSSHSSEINSTHSEGVRLGLEILNAEFDVQKDEILQMLTEMRSCFSLLVPNYEISNNDSNCEDSDLEDNFPSHLAFSSIPVQISINKTVKVKKCDDNDVILENLNGLYKRMTNRFIPLVTGWMASSDLKYDEALEVRITEMESMLFHEKSRYEQLLVESETSSASETSDDSDFEEVDAKPEWMQLPCLFPTPVRNSTSTLSEEPGSSRSVTTGVAQSATEQGSPSCRAVLRSGKLCPRQDRTKCPFHGQIIPRDERGMPLDSNERELEEERLEREKGEEVDWQDATFLKELKAKIGMDLTIRKAKKGKKSFAERYPALIPLVECHARKRLRSKLSKAKAGRKRCKAYHEEYVSISDAPLP